MWGALIIIAVASCNAELPQIKTADLPTTADHRIIGGSTTTIEQYPFAVQVFHNFKYHCGGSLVTTRHILSAANCFVDKNNRRLRPDRFTIREGTTILNSGGSVHAVKEITVHELYNRKTMENDLAVVLMATAVDLTTSIAQLAFVPYPDSVVPEKSSVTAVGWGRTEAAKPAGSTVLNEVTIRMINLKICIARYGMPFTSSVICAGILDVGGKGVCLGDSGGALVYNGIVVGVTSLNVHCADPKFPAIFARIASYINWIEHVVNEPVLQKDINAGNTGSLSSKFGAITLFTPILYLILSV